MKSVPIGCGYYLEFCTTSTEFTQLLDKWENYCADLLLITVLQHQLSWGTLLCVLEPPSWCSASQQFFYLYSNRKLALSTKTKVICIPLCMLTVFLWMQHNTLETGMWRVWKALIFFLRSPFSNHTAKGYSGNSKGKNLQTSQKSKPTACAGWVYLAHICDYEMTFKLLLKFIWIMIHSLNFLSPPRTSAINKPTSCDVLQSAFELTSQNDVHFLI